MKRLFLAVGVIGIIIAAVVYFVFIKDFKRSGLSFTQKYSIMELRSSAFIHNGDIPSKYTCDGKNANPPLLIDDAPEGTKSFALIMDDPDATDGGTFDHWILWNISSETKKIEEGSAPAGAVQGTNDFGKQEYGGPCPPAGHGKHRYMFKLYALGTMLDIPSGSKKEDVEKAMEGYILNQTTLIGLYGR